MADLVNRQDVLNLARDIVSPTKEWRYRCIDPDKVKELPAVKQWIPISSGEFPDFGIHVLVTSGPQITIGWRDQFIGGGWQWKLVSSLGDIIAWMPIPKYEGE